MNGGGEQKVFFYIADPDDYDGDERSLNKPI